MAKDDENNDDESEQWDPHGLQASATIRLNKLDAFKRYKISDVSFYDRSQCGTVGAGDSFLEMVSLRPNGVYTKSQLQKELETLSTCGMFEKVDLEAKTNPNGTIGITVSFSESKWQSANSFKCINVGLMAQSKPIEMSPNMTEREMEYVRSLERV